LLNTKTLLQIFFACFQSFATGIVSATDFASGTARCIDILKIPHSGITKYSGGRDPLPVVAGGLIGKGGLLLHGPGSEHIRAR